MSKKTKKSRLNNEQDSMWRENFDTPLTAKLGETVFFLCKDLEKISEEYKLYVSKIVKGIVKEIRFATYADNLKQKYNSVCLRIEREDGVNDDGIGNDFIKCFGITEDFQEMFFQSLEEATKAAEVINKSTFSTAEIDWRSKLIELIKPKYSYILQLPVKPNQVLQVPANWLAGDRFGKRFYPEWTHGILTMHSETTKIKYIGRTATSAAEQEYSPKYSIKKNKQK